MFFSIWRRCPRCLCQKSPVVSNFLLCRGCPSLRTRGQLEKDWGPSRAWFLRRGPPSAHQHQWKWPESSYQFTYLGCTISSNIKIDREVDHRLAKANSAFGRPYKCVWNNKQLKKDTKISLYRAVVLTTLLHGSESLATYRQHLRLLEFFHQCCLHTILNIHWSKYVSNVEVLDQAKITSIEAMLLKS